MPRPTLSAAVLGLALFGAAALPAFPERAPRTSDRIQVLEEVHGYFPCSDCHADLETNPTPRLLQEEHAEPLEWDDAEGVTHLVEFGEYLPIGELLDDNGIPGLRGENLARTGRRYAVREWMEANDADPADSVWVLTHGGANIWCLDCHDETDRDKLRKMNGDLVTFNESHLLCGQCHGPILTDWEQGVHGRTNGYWDLSRDEEGVTMRLLCVECHTPHAPRFRGMESMPKPVPRIANISVGDTHREVHDEAKRARDEMGPHPWMVENEEGATVPKSDPARGGH